MADRRTKKTAKQIFGYARLNFHMGMRQGKNLAVLLCMGCFCLLYTSCCNRGMSNECDHGDRFGGLLIGYIGLITVPVAYN